jgi:integrase
MHGLENVGEALWAQGVLGKGDRMGIVPPLAASSSLMWLRRRPESLSQATRRRCCRNLFEKLHERSHTSDVEDNSRSSSTLAFSQSITERLVRDEDIGHRLVRQMERKHVSAIVARRSRTPGAANDVLKKLRILLRFAIDNGMRKDDPTVRIKSFAEGTFHTWTDEEISAFESHWPIGTRERTAFALFLYTGQGLSDVRRMSWRDVEGSTIKVIQGKTKAELWIPLHPDLSTALAAWPRTHMVMLTTHYGEPHSVKGLGNWMAATIAQAGLPDRCVTHGLRKAAARRLAEAGCTAHQIMSITGHQSMKELQCYTNAVERNA